MSDVGETDIQAGDEVGVGVDDTRVGVGVGEVLLFGTAVAVFAVEVAVALPASLVAANACAVPIGVPVEVLCVSDPGAEVGALGRRTPPKTV